MSARGGPSRAAAADRPPDLARSGERYRNRGGVDRAQELSDLGPIRGIAQNVDAARPGAAMGDVEEHLVERQRDAVVEQLALECEPRKQARRHEAVGAEGRRGV